MTATLQRDQAIKLAKSDPRKALAKAREVSDPWFRAQALSWVARFTDADPEPIAAEAAKAAAACQDNYKQSAVRAWEIAALAERKCLTKATIALRAAVKNAQYVQPPSSRSEALWLLMQAAFIIHREEAALIGAQLIDSRLAGHWRCERAAKHAAQLLEGKLEPRKFFW